MPGMTTRLHCLSATLERYVIIEGQGEVTVGNRSPQPVQELDVVNIPACAPKYLQYGTVRPDILVHMYPTFYRGELSGS